MPTVFHAVFVTVLFGRERQSCAKVLVYDVNTIHKQRKRTGPKCVYKNVLVISEVKLWFIVLSLPAKTTDTKADEMYFPIVLVLPFIAMKGGNGDIYYSCTSCF